MTTPLRVSLFVVLFCFVTLVHPIQAQGILTPEGGFRLNADAGRIGSTDKDLTFTPVTPCRVADTRVVGGTIAANNSRSFLAVAVAAGVDFAFQGGSNTDCGVGAVRASAVAINVTAVSPAAAGFATVYPYGATRPVAASVNYAAGAVVNNTVVVGIPNPLTVSDFTIYTFAAANYVIDIVGYYSLPEATQPSCVGTTVGTASVANGANISFNVPACAAGYQATTPYCWASDVAGVFLTGSGLDANAPGNPAFCSWQNNSGTTAVVRMGAVCCRVPGK